MLEGPIRDAIDKGIPVITVNSGTVEESQKLGALMHVGQPEYEAGLGAGKRAKDAGVTSFLCVNHYITNPQSTERCRGFADGMGVELGSQMSDLGIDPSEVQNKMQAYLTANPDTGAILTLGPNSAEPSIRAVKELGVGRRHLLWHLRSVRRNYGRDQGWHRELCDRPATLLARLDPDPGTDGLCALRRCAQQLDLHRSRLCDQRQHREGQSACRRVPQSQRTSGGGVGHQPFPAVTKWIA
ncbi:MAG: substrate-binding domain-containing protein [Paracoccaceae bacterium]